MAKRKGTPAAAPHDHSSHAPAPQDGTTRRFTSRGVIVEITEAKDRAALTLDGIPIEVEMVDGQYFSHLAHMFTGFGSMDALVDTLLASEGRTWSLHGHVCDERCASHGGHHDHGSHHGGAHHHDGGHHDHDHGTDRASGAKQRPRSPRRGGRR